jgi:hypothetical protein
VNRLGDWKASKRWAEKEDHYQRVMGVHMTTVAYLISTAQKHLRKTPPHTQRDQKQILPVVIK